MSQYTCCHTLLDGLQSLDDFFITLSKGKNIVTCLGDSVVANPVASQQQVSLEDFPASSNYSHVAPSGVDYCHCFARFAKLCPLYSWFVDNAQG